VHRNGREGHLRQQPGAVEQRPQGGQLVATCIRPIIVFADSAALLRSSLSRHFDLRRLEHGHPSASPQAGVLHH
jgi:hypothetical protein